MTLRASNGSSNSYPIRAVERVCAILDALANNPAGLALQAVAKEADMPKSSTFRYLAALEARHYVGRDDSGSLFQLGVAFRPQSTQSIERLKDLANPVLDKLRDRLE